jgi:hypothetical protein
MLEDTWLLKTQRWSFWVGGWECRGPGVKGLGQCIWAPEGSREAWDVVAKASRARVGY